MAAVPAKTPQVAAAAMSVDWGRRRGEMKRKRPELDAGRAIAAANLVASTRARARHSQRTHSNSTLMSISED
ncbi:hypothetical protein OsI_27349 [Oryza sativa Indica Group]|uniref:Uncharacterized protein n=1 Tax=Oryza sativa subsp. indica TaxID=39946 RepID=B8B631_ORYSI|nr:hypothetical protein OsI_27349 [Oryza sativa Indica Group]